ncbi:RNA polymerase sigma-70 factor, ECF subfamily [Cyclonatronum proteinivorum]|uniref:RNA polymerase sigma-70 factor, ECF subfamily n=1 Tax=Cyclonatronum proteinivorum TaxID=1457365 RepID=A0A345UHV1_9BACT|nr:RNA polymerase sigma factor [Cyclonatronum proteinivorum]AXJ00053.1 RNA polymerase sigma-70 factor, ECF subfamily [Cyclonatronum proteinivorum]
MKSALIQVSPQLVSRLKAGDREAFRAVVELLRKQAYAHALMLVRTHEDAADLSQQAFIALWQHRGRLDPERPLYPWFYTALRRLGLNRLRDDGRRPEQPVSEAAGWLTPVSADADPQQQLENSEHARLLEQCLGRLNAADREILVLRELDGCSYAALAELLQIPQGTVMSRLYTARKRLKNELEKAGYEYP